MILTAWLVLIIALLIITALMVYAQGGDWLKGLAVVLTTILFIGSVFAIFWSMTVILY